MKIGLSKSGPGMTNIKAGIRALNGADVLVGIPAEKASRKNGGINNAELLFIFTNGSPLHGQLPRVVIEAAIQAEPTKGLIAKEFAAASICAMQGDEKGMLDHLDRAGTIGESASKRWFTNPANHWAPNTASTIRAKGSETPGIDTGQMRRAITHVVEAGSGIQGAVPQDKSSAPKQVVAPEGEAPSTASQGSILSELGKASEDAGEELATGIGDLGEDAAEGLEALL